MLKRKKTLSKLLATTMVLTSFTVNASAAEVNTSTIGGNDRYETAIKISENGWSSSDRAVLINGEKGLVDALTATPYAYAKNAPILITAQGKLTTSTKNRLSAMNVKNVDIVGGVNSVSNQVVNDLKNMGITVNRISGASRYDTSLAVAKEVDKIQDVSEIAVVNGDKGIPDAVSVAAPAASKKMPILLAENGGLNSASKDFVNGESVSKSYVIGSSNSVSDSVMNSLPGTKTRLGGADRHDTNAAVIKEFYTASSLSNVYVAKSGYVKNNDEIVDALAAGVLAAKNGNPVVLVGNSINSSQQTLLAGKKFTKLTQIGMGVPANSVNQIKATQADEESAVNSVSVVDYKTIKVTGKLLDKLSASSFSVSGNSVSSYTPNTAGTEATIAFSKAFDSSNTLSVTSNLGKVTTHTFTYNTNISSVQASTKEVGKSGLQYLEVTVNGSEKRSVKQLNEQGWKVEFTANMPVFYGGKSTSEDGKLITSFDGATYKTFNYEVKLTKGNATIPSEKGYVDIVDKVSQLEKIDSFKLSLEDVVLNSNTAVLNDVIDITDFKAINKNGSEKNLESLTYINEIDVKSSNESVVSVQKTGALKNQLTAVSVGSSTITVTDGTVSKTVTISVKEAQRKASTATVSNSRLYVASGEKEVKTTVTVKDQYGDPMKGYKGFNSGYIKSTTGEKPQIATYSIAGSGNGKNETNSKGALDIVFNSHATNTGSGSLVLKNDDDKTWATINVNVSKIDKSTSFKLENIDSKADNVIDVYSTDDKNVTYNINEYNSYYLYGTALDVTAYNKASEVPKPDVTSTETKYAVVSSDTDVATVDVNDVKDSDNKIIAKNIVVNAVKQGSTDLKIYVNGVYKTKTTITVKDNTPSITNIDFRDVEKIKEATNGYDVIQNVLDLAEYNDETLVGGIAVSGKGGDVIYNPEEKSLEVYKGKENDKVVYTEIGKIEVTNDFGVDTSNPNVVNLKAGDKGNILIKVYVKRSGGTIDINSNPIIKIIEVDIPTSN